MSIPSPKRTSGSKFWHRESDIAINANLAEDLKLAKAGDVAAIHRITLDNMALLVSICKRMRLSLGFDDLLQEAAMHMPKVINGFDPDRGFKFSTYVTTAMYRHLKRKALQTGGAIRIPVASYDKNIPGTRNIVNTGVDFGLIKPEAEVDRVEETEDLIVLRHAMQQLNPRMRLALHLRFYEGLKLEGVGEQLGVTRERARQIILEGLHDLRLIMNGQAEAEAA